MVMPGCSSIRARPKSFTLNRPLRVLFLGQVNLRKGMAVILEAMRLLKNEPVEFWFVGPRQMETPIESLNNKQARWLGGVARGEAQRYYQEADVFLFPSFSDGFGLTQLEAQAWKLPIIASRPDVSISSHEGAVPRGVVMVMSQRPTSLTSRGRGAFGCAVGGVAAPDASAAINNAKNRVI